jgi:2-polyprenyl-3-methyl-5-hydroxy-6-metoxy-1,4-benzoquinol methylase
MESFSNVFLNRHTKVLKPYAQKWVADPLHQWSRQWEYPFVDHHVQKLAAGTESVHVLDAGSGITFFPWWLMSQHPNLRVTAVDLDPLVPEIGSRLNLNESMAVDFSTAPLSALPYADNSFDLLYCISVLEHLDQRDEVIAELHRVLKPGGSFILTFDVSPNSTAEIPVADAVALVDALQVAFDLPEPRPNLPGLPGWADRAYSTREASRQDLKLLPWTRPTWRQRWARFRWTRRLEFWPPWITVCGLVLKKSAD